MIVKEPIDLKLFLPSSQVEIEKISDDLIKNLKLDFEKIISENKASAKRSLLKDLDDVYAKFSSCLDRVHLTSSVSKNKELRELALENVKKLYEFSINTFISKDLYKILANFLETFKDSLSQEEAYFAEKELLDLRLSGCGLSEVDFKRFKELGARLANVCSDFEANISADNSKIKCSIEDLEGVSENLLKGLEKDQGGSFILGHDYPTHFEVMKNCKVSQTRKKMFILSGNKAYPKNEAVLQEMVELRMKIAELLGFDDFASKSFFNKMAKNPESVEAFLKEVSDASSEKFENEVSLFSKNLPEGVSLSDKNEFFSWDLSFIISEYKKNKFNFNENLVSEYFPVEKTISGLFKIYQDLLDLRFEIKEGDSVPSSWHEDVKLIEVFKSGSRERIGFIYIDLFPREGKYSHACCYAACLSRRDSPSLPVSVVIANFPKDCKENPGLLKHSDVITFFHEFGHAMHSMLSDTEFFQTAGTNTLRDFVETPSQMFEEWMWEPEALKRVSSHYKTGKSLSSELIQKIIDLRKLDIGFFLKRQLYLSEFSFLCFSKKNNFSSFKDLQSFCKKKHGYNVEDLGLSNFFAAFGHLSGYEASYYGYLWSRVFAQDIFSEIKKLGIFSKESGGVIRKLLSAGGSLDPNKLLESVLKRKPSTSSFKKLFSEE